MLITKRDGRQEIFQLEKLITTITQACLPAMGTVNVALSEEIALCIQEQLKQQLRMHQLTAEQQQHNYINPISTQTIHELIIAQLCEKDHNDISHFFSTYRQQRDRLRLQQSELYNISEAVIGLQDMDLLRENANVNGESFSGKMSKMGSEYAKWHVKQYVLPNELREAIDHNYVYVHDLDQYAIGTTNCIFIPFDRLLAEGFNTGNGSVRTPQSIMTAMALVAIIFQSQQNSQFGGVSANKIDWDLAPYVRKSFVKHMKKGLHYFNEGSDLTLSALSDDHLYMDNEKLKQDFPKSYTYAFEETVSETHQAAESLIHNLNTMSSRAGGQIPFTSLNYGMCTSTEGRLVSHALLQATSNGLGNGETPIFPQHIFQCKTGINQLEGDPNYDLFQKAIECSSKRLYPNFVNVDATFNLIYYREDDPNTIIATMGCRTRSISDRFGRNYSSGKGNLSFNTINLVKLGIEYGICQNQREQADIAGFYKALQSYMDVAISGLIHRFGIQAKQPAKASDFMMREGVWEGGKDLHPDQEVADLIKHGSLAVGFIGLAECMNALYGKHHGEDTEVYKRALSVISFMRQYCDDMSEKYNLNITLFATPAEGLSGKFTKADQKNYGKLTGITDREYYTNSFHIPVYYSLSAFQKIKLEAPFHELCNAGAITYIELDGNARQNTVAFQQIVQYALKSNVGYFSINHPLDRCPSCGYEGIIGTECPNCGSNEDSVHFQRLRRVTGYITGDYTQRFNSAKQAEVLDRVKHK
ncbi:anaerobic ribonucleoside triphosphate reductase [Brevibacillus laterosporus]|uniref:anaerobic ribonucleoside triphosphate reductase n=1 Tax=Brevibacillus laterosporus TaxID=1465 RepID=UPI0018CD832D|nr:anaerobic ribonucleoside triphosphate reductase [Brevibacillus laterosporus]